MTAIAIRDGRLSVDRQTTMSGIRTTCLPKYRKIRLPKKGACIVVMSGYNWGIDKIMEQLYIHEEGTGENIGEMNREARYGFAVDKFLRVYPVYGDGRIGIQEVNECGFYAEGSAYQFLMGAMAQGATTAEAVQLATEYCDGCGFGVDTVDIKEFLQYE